MSQTNVKTPKVVKVAERIEADIRKKGLRAGDTYLSTEETAKMLKTGTRVVNNALRLLVQRGRLERKQRKGTFIRDPDSSPDRPLRRVHLLVQRDYLKTEGLLADGQIVGMQGALGDAELQFNFLPTDGEEAYVQKLVDEARSSSEVEGFVLVRSSMEIQRLIGHTGLPAVVEGMVFPSVPPMPWVDCDQRAAGRLQTERALGTDHQSVLVLMRDRMLAGDYPYLDGIREALSQKGVSVEGFTTRHLPADHEIIREEIRYVLQQSKRLPGIVARSEPLAEGAASAVESLGLKVGEDVTITVGEWYRRASGSRPAYPFIRYAVTTEEIGQRVGRFLVQRALGQGKPTDREIIPVTLEEPRQREA